MPEFLCQFYCTHWNLKSIFQILAFRPFFLNTLLFTYHVPKPPCQCNWKQARRKLDGSDEWKCDTDPSTHNPLAGIQERLTGMKSNHHLMAGQWSVRNELVISSPVPHRQVFMLQFLPSVTVAPDVNERPKLPSLSFELAAHFWHKETWASALNFIVGKQRMWLWMFLSFISMSAKLIWKTRILVQHFCLYV